MTNWDEVHWFKSSDSNDVGCVEVGFGDNEIGIRDSKDTSKAPHVYTRHEWECFLSGAKRGEFDIPQR